MNLRTIESAGFVVIFRDRPTHRYLLLKHSAQGHWDFPKGKLEKGESREMAAERELFEEAGIKAQAVPGFYTAISYDCVVSNGTLAHKTVHFFLTYVATPDIVLSAEHTEYCWLSYEKACEQLTFPTARAVLEHAHAFSTAPLNQYP